MLGDIFSCHNGGKGESGLVARGQEDQEPYNAQDSQAPSPNKELELSSPTCQSCYWEILV